MGIVYLLERKSKESNDLAKLISQLETNVDMVSRNKNCTRLENNVALLIAHYTLGNIAKLYINNQKGIPGEGTLGISKVLYRKK